jgi:hypothetical protein
MPYNLIQNISTQVKTAEQHKHKIAMFHLQVLLNAEALKDYDPEGFCLEIGVRKTYATEFRKMIAVHALMEKNGIALLQPTNGMLIKSE